MCECNAISDFWRAKAHRLCLASDRTRHQYLPAERRAAKGITSSKFHKREMVRRNDLCAQRTVTRSQRRAVEPPMPKAAASARSGSCRSRVPSRFGRRRGLGSRRPRCIQTTVVICCTYPLMRSTSPMLQAPKAKEVASSVSGKRYDLFRSLFSSSSPDGSRISHQSRHQRRYGGGTQVCVLRASGRYKQRAHRRSARRGCSSRSSVGSRRRRILLTTKVKLLMALAMAIVLLVY